jgi:hypothetical protein
MDCIKTEHDPDAEVYSASCSEIQLVDDKHEEQPVSINFPPAKDGNDYDLYQWSMTTVPVLLMMGVKGTQNT